MLSEALPWSTSRSSEIDISAVLDVARVAARAAGAVHPSSPQVVANRGKLDGSDDVVTDIDVAAERAAAEAIRRARPDDAIVGEEGTRTTGRSGVTWFLDGVDGTANLVRGYPMYTTAVGAQLADGRRVGAIVDTTRDVVYSGATGVGAWRSSDPIRVVGSDLAGAVISTGFSHRASKRAEQGTFVERLLSVVRDLRRTGSPALDLAFVANGSTSGHLEHGLKPWDIVAGAALVEGAGGVTAIIGHEAAGQPLFAAGSRQFVDEIAAFLDDASVDEGWRPEVDAGTGDER